MSAEPVSYTHLDVYKRQDQDTFFKNKAKYFWNIFAPLLHCRIIIIVCSKTQWAAIQKLSSIQNKYMFSYINFLRSILKTDLSFFMVAMDGLKQNIQILRYITAIQKNHLLTSSLVLLSAQSLQIERNMTICLPTLKNCYICCGN